jgi:hypothetical protein
MQRPEVRIVQDQDIKINNNPQIDNWEAEQLMRKYGYQNTQYSSNQEAPLPSQDNGLTFEQMIAQEEARIRDEKLRRQQQLNGPKPISFDGGNGYHTETKYGSDDDSGYGFKIQITSDMPIPKY